MTKRRLRGSGGLFRKKGSRFWYLSFYDPITRKQVQESSESESKMFAESKLRERLVEVGKGLPVAESLKLRYEDIKDSLLTYYRINKIGQLKVNKKGEERVDGLIYLDDFFKNRLVRNISPELIRKFIEKRQSQGAENATINRNTSLLRKMISLAYQDGKVAIIPKVHRLPEADPRDGFVEATTFVKLRAALPEHLRPLITFLFYTGARVGSARKITWKQITFNGDRAELRLARSQTKTKKPLTIILPKELSAVLKEMKRNGDLVFDSTNLRKEWIRACVECKLGKQDGHRYEGLIVHDLHRSGVRNLIRSGVDESIAMKISGHRTNSVFKRYNISSVRDIHDAMVKVELYNERMMENPEAVEAQ